MNGWSPDYVKFVNLFSHENSYFPFKKHDMILLLGENVDRKNGANSNGSGKSVVLEAVTLAVTGHVHRGITKDRFVMRGKDFCHVEINFHHPVNKQDFRIERTFYRSSKSTVSRVYIDDVENKEYDKRPNDLNKYIFEVLGVSEEDFVNYFVISQGNDYSFFTAGDAKQKEVISRFSNIAMLDNVLEKLKEELNEQNEVLVLLKGQKSSIEENVRFLVEDIEEKQGRFDEQRKQRIEKIQLLRNNVLGEIKKNSIQHDIHVTKMQNLEGKIVDTKKLKEELQKLKQERQGVRSQIESIENLITTLKSVLNKHNVCLEGKVTCPNCRYEFVLDSELSLKDLQIAILRTQKSVEKETDRLSKLNEDLSEIKLKIDQKTNEIDGADSIQNEYNQHDEERQSLHRRLVRLREERDGYVKQIKEIEEETIEEVLSLQNEKLSKQMVDLDETEELIRKSEKQVVGLNQQLLHLGRSGFKTYLANKSIKLIQDMTNFYLKRFESSLRVHISGFKVLKTSEIRDKIEVKVFDGNEEGVFNQLSGGEKQRITACGILALQTLINNTSSTGGVDLLQIDEIAYLDAAGQAEIVKILSKSGVTSVLVLHHIEELAYKNKVYVRKKDGKSVVIA